MPEKDLQAQIIKEVNKEFLEEDENEQKRAEKLRKTEENDMRICEHFFEIGGLDIRSESFIKSYGKEPMMLFKKFVKQAVEENQKLWIEKIQKNPDKNLKSLSYASQYEGVARLFNYYGLDFLGYLQKQGEASLNPWEKLDKKIKEKMFADLERAVMKHRYYTHEGD